MSGCERDIFSSCRSKYEKIMRQEKRETVRKERKLNWKKVTFCVLKDEKPSSVGETVEQSKYSNHTDSRSLSLNTTSSKAPFRHQKKTWKTTRLIWTRPVGKVVILKNPTTFVGSTSIIMFSHDKKLTCLLFREATWTRFGCPKFLKFSAETYEDGRCKYLNTANFYRILANGKQLTNKRMIFRESNDMEFCYIC
jgi:hypothetical protein